jgi:hypothetical protein
MLVKEIQQNNELQQQQPNNAAELNDTEWNKVSSPLSHMT